MGNIDDTIAELRRQFGEMILVRLKDRPMEIPAISTGILSVDLALGIGGVPRGRITEIYGPEGAGKAQPLDAKVLTPHGWRNIGDLEVGDLVVDPATGKDAAVIGVYPQGKRPIYRIVFNDEATTECDIEHLWLTWTHWRREKGLPPELRTLSDILPWLKRRRYGVFIPVTKPVEFAPGDALPVPPYLLGVLLGDGGLSQSSVLVTTVEPEIIDAIRSLLPEGLDVRRQGDTPTYRLTAGRTGGRPNPLKEALKSLGLMGLRSHEKFIPASYLRASIEDRAALLQGLMDTDGYADTNGSISYTTTSRQLRDDFVELVRSLGGVAVATEKIAHYRYRGTMRQGRTAYTVSFRLPAGIHPFRLARKLERYRPCPPMRRIVSVERVGEKDAVCIMLDSPAQLYITDNYIVTHNTTLAQHIVAACQAGGGTAVYIDMEHKMDPGYMAACGVDIDSLIISQPPSGTTAFDLVRRLTAANEVDLIVVDSVAALVSDAELDAGAGDQFVGIQARMMSQNLKALVPILGLSKTALVFINQTRVNIGLYGSPETTPGGKALKFYASVRARVSRIGTLGPRGKEHGIRSRFKVQKSSVAPPWQEAEFDIEWGKGVSREADVLEAASKVGVITQAGGWYSFGETRIGHGRVAAKTFLAEHPELMEKIRETVLRHTDDEETVANAKTVATTPAVG